MKQDQASKADRERKQMDAFDVQDRASWAKNRLEFLRNAFMSTREIHLTVDGLAGLCRIVEDVAGSLDEIVEAEIVMKGEAKIAPMLTAAKAGLDDRRVTHWPEIQKQANEADAKVRGLLAFVFKVEDPREQAEDPVEDVFDIERMLRAIGEHTATLKEIANREA